MPLLRSPQAQILVSRVTSGSVPAGLVDGGQARLACALLAGGTLKDAASRIGISPNTAKSQLQVDPNRTSAGAGLLAEIDSGLNRHSRGMDDNLQVSTLKVRQAVS